MTTLTSTRTHAYMRRVASSVILRCAGSSSRWSNASLHCFAMYKRCICKHRICEHKVKPKDIEPGGFSTFATDFNVDANCSYHFTLFDRVTSITPAITGLADHLAPILLVSAAGTGNSVTISYACFKLLNSIGLRELERAECGKIIRHQELCQY